MFHQDLTTKSIYEMTSVLYIKFATPSEYYLD